jgi:deoxyribodipyrimidine photo-lyase
MLQVVWFKRDLRVHDHEPLRRAAERGPVLPLYVIEPELWRQADASARHWGFLRECLRALADELSRLGAPLQLRRGDIVTVLNAIRAELGPFVLHSHQETGNAWTYERDRAVQAWTRSCNIEWREYRQHGVFRGLRQRDGWAQRWEAQMSQPLLAPPRVLQPVCAPTIDCDALAIEFDDEDIEARQRGGRPVALDLLQSFLSERGANYHREMSSPLSAASSCSRLSAHLAAGTLSIREVFQATTLRLERERAAGARSGWATALQAYTARLHWHCHFVQKLESQPDLEFRNLHRAFDGLRERDFDTARFTAWGRGETGYPLVDACMRSLRQTGWLNFRMRAMLMAFAAYHLWLHWREPGLHLARQFTDYEPGIHWSQVQMQSGTTGINRLRIYNPVKQSRDQDPEGRFIRRWVPELAGVDAAFLHEPWRMSASAQQRAGCRIGRDYPRPIVDHEAAARAARRRVEDLRRRTGFGEEARDVMSRHGSRRRRPGGSRRQLSPEELQLDLLSDS